MRGEAMMPSGIIFPLKEDVTGKRSLAFGRVSVYSMQGKPGGYFKFGGNGMKSTNGKMGILKWAMLVGGALLFGSVVSFIVRAFDMV